jgi:hypothetical protein
VLAALQQWRAIVGLLPLIAATNALAQPAHVSLTHPPISHKRTIDLRLVEEPGFDRAAPPNRGVLADTPLGANMRLGLQLITVSRPRLGPEWRVDGRMLRSRKPAVTFAYRF